MGLQSQRHGVRAQRLVQKVVVVGGMGLLDIAPCWKASTYGIHVG